MDEDNTNRWLRKVEAALFDAISWVPHTNEEEGSVPKGRAREIVRKASLRAAVVAGGLAIPPGPLGLMTIMPDLIAIWRIQAQMVADIAGVYGKVAFLGKEQMVYCLFKHAGSQLVKDLAVRVGGRLLIRRASLRVIQRILTKVGVRVTQRITGRILSRWIPLIGAGAIAAYAYYDTYLVGRTSLEFFQSDLGTDPTEVQEDSPEPKSPSGTRSETREPDQAA